MKMGIKTSAGDVRAERDVGLAECGECAKERSMKEEETTGPGLAIEGPIKLLSWISSVVGPQKLHHHLARHRVGDRRTKAGDGLPSL